LKRQLQLDLVESFQGVGSQVVLRRHGFYKIQIVVNLSAGTKYRISTRQAFQNLSNHFRILFASVRYSLRIEARDSFSHGALHRTHCQSGAYCQHRPNPQTLKIARDQARLLCKAHINLRKIWRALGVAFVIREISVMARISLTGWLRSAFLTTCPIVGSKAAELFEVRMM
jgi:hypothetical protein